MEAGAGASLYHCIGVFRNFAGKDFCGVGIAGLDGVLGTCGETAAAADTFAVIDMSLAVFNTGAIMGADAYAGTTADAKLRIDNGFSFPVLFHLAGAGATAHAKVLQRAAKAGLLMAFEVAERNHDVRIHDGLTDLGFLYIGKIDGDKGLIRTFQAVGYDDMASGLEGRKAVEIGGVHVIKRVLAATDIKGVAVSEKRFTAQFTHIICDNLRVLRTQMGKIAEFAEVNLNGSVLVLKMDLLKAGLFHKPVQLLG